MASKSCSKDFEVLNKLGQGSFGTVFKVRRKLDKNFYVMKIINISQMDRRGQQESINEVKILASLDSPYIVKYFDSFIENKTLHIIMEFCDKGDLSQAIRSQMGRLIAEPKIWKYYIQMCLGLEFCHSKKILHRDIKSMNVFLIRDDVVRIGDLGVAKVLANTAAFAHTMVGTPYYLSPELCEEKPYNVKSDVWALGCVLYELCTLKHPFDALNQAALLLKIIKGSYAPISTSYSNELKELVDLCMLKDYRKRPNIPAILTRTGMKDRALGLGIGIPQGSVLAGAGVMVFKEPALIYQAQMAVIEEEKVSKSKDSRGPSPGPSKNIAKKDPAVPIKIPEAKKMPEQKKIPESKAKIEAAAKNQADVRDYRVKEVKPVDKPLENKLKVEPAGRSPVEVKDIRVKDLKVGDKIPAPAVSNRAKEDLDNNALQKAKFEPATHMNNIKFEPPLKIEQRPSEPKFKAPQRMTPKNIAQRLEHKLDVKPDPFKIAVSKAVIKPSPRIDIKQKVIRPGAQAPHFMPPQRPQDPKPLKREPDPPKLTDEAQEVLELPNYPKPKKSITSNPVLISFSVKSFEALSKPIFEDTPFFLEQFGETIDWNFSQTGFSGKDIIPVSTISKNLEFQVNYARSTSLDSGSDEENDDELYQVSDSEGDTIEEEGEFEGESNAKASEDVADRMRKIEKQLADVVRLEDMRRTEIIKRVGIQVFEEMYEFFKMKASSEEELNDEDQKEIENFMYTRVSIENTDICIIISKLFHNEKERVRLEEELESLESMLM